MVETQWGPLGPADRDLLFKVKQAGLWEMPAADKVGQKSTNPKFTEAAKTIRSGHVLLDRVVNRAGLLLGVDLPQEPNSDQQGWLGEMDAAAAGDEFEAVFANRLRAAHGKVYGVVAGMRAGTRNELIRILANQAMITVLEHITALEATGRVDFNSLPSPAVAAPTSDQAAADGGVTPTVPPGSRFNRAGQESGSSGGNGVLIAALAVLIGSLVGMRFLKRTKKKASRRHAQV
ncbi:DUF4142 domain-containing protein [Lentzea tibetensis]|uniref:DUF4142 domain-containing protein n=1 Tax=Lentzea tibetensis TaxID=2591470 RepID=UPI001647EAAD|nr:DUF4142 domain-containing protein [Lentzea tibetensis]